MVEAQRCDVDWAAVRRDYELTNETIRSLCERYGVSKSALESRWKKERWLSRRAANQNRHGSTKDRLYAVLERQVVKLANAGGDKLTDNEAKQLSELVKNFVVLGTTSDGEADNGGPPKKKDMSDLRDKLAKRIDQFKRR